MSSSAGSVTHYSTFSRSVHWLVVILMAGMFYTGFTGFGGGPRPGAGGPGGPGGPGGGPAMTMSMRPAGAPGAGAPGAGAPPAAGAPGAGPSMSMSMRPAGSMAMQGAGGPPGGGMREQSPWGKIPLHKAMGFTILVLALVRIIYRLVCRVPEMPSDMPGWQSMAARGVQGLIYLGMLVQPLSGWLGSGRSFTYFGIFTMPQMTTFLSTDYGQQLRWVHQNVDWALIWLISLHAIGALYHHYVRKDNVLLSMLRGA